MALHAAAMMAFFVDQAQQTPMQIQCVPAAPEPTLKWLLPTIIQTIISLASITAGVLIALWSFRKTKELTEWSFRSTSERDHERWVLDQKKVEWKEILFKVAEIEHDIPIILKGFPEHRDLQANVLGILPLLRGSVFVFPVLESSGFVKRWESFVTYVSGRFMARTQTNRAVQTGTVGMPVSGEDIVRWLNLSTDEELEVRKRLYVLLRELRSLAQVSLGLKDDHASQEDSDSR